MEGMTSSSILLPVLAGALTMSPVARIPLAACDTDRHT